MQGRIIKQISNQYTVDFGDKVLTCIARGKFRKLGLVPCCGDIVEVNLENNLIEDIRPRVNMLDRPVVANVDVALIVTSIKKPDLSLSLLDKELSIIISKNIEPVIVLTKLDLMNSKNKKDLKPLIKYYKNLGIKIFDNKRVKKIKKYLKGKVVVLTGQTGAGKSSLLNKMDKSLNIETKPISVTLNRGVHTTRHTEIYNIDNVYMIDTPGFSAIDFKEITETDLNNTFIEFRDKNCQYKDCKHINEKGCQVKLALEHGLILPSRYINYTRFLKEIHENSSKLFK